jgi:hypothetical protein
VFAAANCRLARLMRREPLWIGYALGVTIVAGRARLPLGLKAIMARACESPAHQLIGSARLGWVGQMDAGRPWLYFRSGTANSVAGT